VRVIIRKIRFCANGLAWISESRLFWSRTSRAACGLNILSESNRKRNPSHPRHFFLARIYRDFGGTLVGAIFIFVLLLLLEFLVFPLPEKPFRAMRDSSFPSFEERASEDEGTSRQITLARVSCHHIPRNRKEERSMSNQTFNLATTFEPPIERGSRGRFIKRLLVSLSHVVVKGGIELTRYMSAATRDIHMPASVAGQMNLL